MANGMSFLWRKRRDWLPGGYWNVLFTRRIFNERNLRRVLEMGGSQRQAGTL